MKNYNVVFNGRNFFDQRVKNNLITYDNTQKIATAQGHDYTTVCLLYKMIAVVLRKQRALVADTEAIQQINFTPFLDQKENTGMFFIIEEAKEPF